MTSFASGSSEQKLTRKILLERNENLNSVAEKFVEELECVQQVIDVFDTEADAKKAGLVASYENSKRPLCERRDNLIRNIPNFWVKTFENHPDIRSLIDRETGERLRYLSHLEVKSLRDTPSKLSFTLNFYFNENPYFENEILSKEAIIKEDDTVSSTNSKIRWKLGKSLGKRTANPSPASRKRKLGTCTFFEWFESNSKNDTFVNGFRKLHQKPLRYYLKSGGDDSDSYYDDDDDDDDGDETDSTEDDGGEEMGI